MPSNTLEYLYLGPVSAVTKVSGPQNMMGRYDHRVLEGRPKFSLRRTVTEKYH